MIELSVLVGIMIIGAVAAISLEGLLSSVIALGTVGQALLLICIFLKAPELAIAYLVVEILVVVILIRATMRRDTVSQPELRWQLPGVAGLLFGIGFLTIAWQSVQQLAPFGAPAARVSDFYAAQAFAQTGAANIVSAVLFDYRAIDALGMLALVFCAVIGVYAILRVPGRVRSADVGSPNPVPPADHELVARQARRRAMPGSLPTGLTVLVTTVTRLTVGLILLFGIYMVLHGHTLHGGALAGGVIIALSFIHIVLAYGKQRTLSVFPQVAAFTLMSAGGLVYVAIALLGYLRGSAFYNFLPKGAPLELISAGVIPLLQISGGVVIGASLFALFIALVGFQRE